MAATVRAPTDLAPPRIARSRQQLRTLRQDPALCALIAIVALGAGLRLYFLIVYRPALLGWSDTSLYLLAAKGPLFTLSWQNAGYPIFLRFLYLLWPRLILVTIVQHILGLVGGVLLYLGIRRAGVPRGLALVPCAVVILGGFELLLEHAILTDAPFVFLVNVSIWSVAMAWSGRRWGAFVTGLALGLAADDREIGLALLPVAAVFLCLTPTEVIKHRAPAIRGRLSNTLNYRQWATRHPLAWWRTEAVVVLVCGALTPMLPYLYAHEQAVGNFDFTTAGAVDLYGRVGQWADCSRFVPPAGTARLCPTEPVLSRSGSGFWEYSPSSPLIRAYGAPTLTPDQNAQVQAFVRAAIEGEPITYAYRVARDLVRIVDPSFSGSPNPAIGNAGGDGGAESDATAMFSPPNAAVDEGIAKTFYASSALHAGNADLLRDWEKGTELQGPVMLLMIVLGLVAPLLARGARRRVALLCLAFAIVLLVGPVATVAYSYRYEAPAFGPLSAAAAIGAYEVWRRCTRWRSSRTVALAGS